jgi:hypothetical protein
MGRRRAWIAVFLFFLIFINFVDRMNLSVAARPIGSEFGLSPVQMGYLFSCFQWSYVICVLPLGVLADRIGTKRLAGWGLALWSAATMVTGATVGFASILTARLALGAGEATSYPALGRVTRDWFPQRERGVVTTNPARDTRRPKCWKSQHFGHLVYPFADGIWRSDAQWEQICESTARQFSDGGRRGARIPRATGISPMMTRDAHPPKLSDGKPPSKADGSCAYFAKVMPT